MTNFFSASQEEQQEIIIAFWQKFKYLILLVLVTIIVFIVGWDYVKSSENEESFNTSSLYSEYLVSDNKENGEKLLSLYPQSIYSDFVRLNEAKKSFNKEEYDQAIALLEAIIKNQNYSSDFNPLDFAARTRLARIYLQIRKFEEVIKIFDGIDDLTSSMLELKGDAENELGKYSEARVSYMLALQNSTNQSSISLINMKIADLAGESLD